MVGTRAREQKGGRSIRNLFVTCWIRRRPPRLTSARGTLKMPGPLGGVAQLVRASGSYPLCPGFKSLHRHQISLQAAQGVRLSSLRATNEIKLLRVLRFPLLSSALAAAVVSTGCATVAQLANPTEERCSVSFESQLSSILIEQSEKADVAATLAHRTYLILTSGEVGPRTFLVSSPSGTDYGFFIQKKRDHCLVRLYGRRKGFVSYTNNLTYISTRELSGCACRD